MMPSTLDSDSRDALTQAVIGAAIEVHCNLGPGLLESIYQECLQQELAQLGLSFQAQAGLPVIYNGRRLTQEFVLDFLFPERLVVELKVVEKLVPVHDAQVLTYIKLSQTPVGLLINFHVPLWKDGIKRLALSQL